MSNIKEELKKKLDQLKSDGLYRQLKVVSGAPEKEIEINKKTYLNFSSNNYLGLAMHPAVRQAASEAASKFGAGGTSSRLVSGTFELHRQLEKELADLKGTDDALVFSTGYQANLGIISGLVKEGDCIIMDRLNHASMWDAAKLSKARIFVYPHKDMMFLEKILIRSELYRRRLIVTDSVFSMDGDLAPLKQITELAERYNAWTMIDEAHATGILGEHGGGLSEQLGLTHKIDVIMGTLSKALGSQGGFVCGSQELIDYLVNRARSLIYTTSLAPSNCAGALAALNIIKTEPERRAGLNAMSKYLRDRLSGVGFNIMGSESHIVPFRVGPIAETLSLSAKLWQDGIFAPAIRPPTVPEGECRLRFSLMSGHTEDDVNRLMTSITS